MEKNTYQHQELKDCFISLHDCRAEKIMYNHGVLSFVFPNGFWVGPQHPENHSDTVARTDLSQVDYKIVTNRFVKLKSAFSERLLERKSFARAGRLKNL